MELRQLKTFLVVADLLSFSQAADTLNYAQSTVSSRIRTLEEELGVPLFDRLGKRVALTEAGRIMVRYAKKLTDMEAETFAEVAGWEEPEGSISVRIPQSLGNYILPQVLSRFQQQYPRVNLDINSCAFSSLKRELRSGITDVAFLLIDAIHEADLKSEVLGFTHLLFVCSNHCALTKKAHVSLKDLENETFLLPKYDCQYNTIFLQTLDELKVKPAATIELNSLQTIKSCVEQQVGVTILPEIAVKEELEQGRFASFQVGKETIETAILMIQHKNKWLSQSMEAFIREVKACFP
ncbi:LysR family transcriptional regulator [Desulfogranum marinum]|uniref:LysR family transcriptional regulator n=1 Tax=Desulfogranum marinum TaxID=453220 RepID=UPI0019653415|nr:LysR family transcriptional regulator [Desulfogranum marinum]